MVTFLDASDDAGRRLAHFVEGRSVATIRWRKLRDNTEHTRETSEETRALMMLDWARMNPRVELISFEVRP